MREPVQIVEIDVDYCSLNYGDAPCTAALGSTGTRKCFNMYRHCQDQENFARSVLTLRFAQPRINMPKDQVYFPVLESASPRSASVNIGGADPRLAALGKRATVTARLKDFPYHDRLLDKYQAERVSGAAQTDEVGYNPATRSTFFRKLKSRWPFYAGRPMRVISGYIDDGILADTQTRHFIITNMSLDDRGNVTITGKDVLDLADNDKAKCPRESSGVLGVDITEAATSLTLAPEGIGDSEYPTSGKIVIGSEIMDFTRSGDVLTLTTRAAAGTTRSSHSAGDSVQVCFEVDAARIDTTIADLLTTYAGIDPSFIPTSTWQAEIDRWASSLVLDAIIPKPEGVAKLVGELAVLGVSIWWDDVNQLIGLKMTRPPDGDTVYTLTDDNAIISASVEDRDEDRLTRVAYYTRMIDPTDGDDDEDNFSLRQVFIDVGAESDNEYDGSKSREIFCRWLNDGNTADVRIAARRLLQRMSDAPQYFIMDLDAKDRAIGLTDVLLVTSDVFTDETGRAVETPMQVVAIETPTPGHRIRIRAQSYRLAVEVDYITPNTTPVFSAASGADQQRYAFFSDSNGLMSDGTPGARFV